MVQPFVRGMVVAAAVAVLVLSGTAAFAGKGVGATFNLGKVNSVDAKSTLTGTTADPMLKITNNGTGTALSLNVKAGVSPLLVNSSTLVANLNADQLDGKNASDFLPVDGKALDSAHADAADTATNAGHAASADSATNATHASSADSATNASELGGLPASAYAQVGSCEDGLVHGWVAVFASSSYSSTYVTTNPNEKNCAGGDVQARRSAQGVYYVRFLNNGSAIAVGNVFEVDQSNTNSACSDDYLTLDYAVDPMFPSGPRVFRVETHDDGGGLEDCTFDLTLV